MHFSYSRTIVRGAAALLALAFVPLAAGQAAAADYTVGAMHITQPWARATPQGATAGAAYMTVTNTGTTADRLSCVSTDAAAQCQIHQMSMEGGVMRMRPVAGGLEIKPGETVTLKPGGYHVMFVGLKQPFQKGQSVAATFKFDSAGTVAVSFPVAAIGAQAPGAAGGMMQMHGQ